MINLDYLDEDQFKAATSGSGIVRVMAGAGTGKTTTLQSRVSYLIDSKICAPSQIMVVTFTNKAAKEIKNRIENSLGRESSSIKMGTFHSLSVRILRKYFNKVGLTSSKFSIIDDDDVSKLMVSTIDKYQTFGSFYPPKRSPNISEDEYNSLLSISSNEFDQYKKDFYKKAKSQIMRWKESGLQVKDAIAYLDEHYSEENKNLVDTYIYYQQELNSRNAVDFPDLILKVVQLFDDNPQIKKYESESLHYILVDEFQDTNMLQYKWLEHLSYYHGNLFVVGDLDQSLYSFRGSAPQILERIGKLASTDVVLKSNRRCTRQILQPANALVDLNIRDHPKILVSERDGSNISFRYAENEFSEANMLASKIKSLINSGVDPNEIAILARAGHVLSPIEKSLVKSSIPFVLVGSKSVLDREEVKDILAYLRLAVDLNNDLAFSRIANKPLRGLGPSSIEYIFSVADSRDLDFATACLSISDETSGGGIRKNSRDSLKQLGDLLLEISSAYEMGVPIETIIGMILDDSNYLKWLEEKKDNYEERFSNIEFLKNFSSSFEDLADFLQEFSLCNDDDVSVDDGVRLSTIHASKGLEFEYVFLPAWEDGIIPSSLSKKQIEGDIDNPWIGPPIGGIEEERRIAHVAITRAKKEVYFSYSKKRGNRWSKISPFISEANISSHSKPDNISKKSFTSNNMFSGIKFKKNDAAFKIKF